MRMNRQSAYTDLSDEELFELVRNNDEEAFRVLYRRYDRRIFAYCFRALGRRDAAEDVFQTIVMTIFEKRDSFTGGHFAGWLFTITRNQTIKALKKQKATSNIDDIAFLLNDESDRTGEDVFMNEILRNAIDQLPDEFKRTLIMKHVEGHSYEHIAREMDCTVSLAKVRVFRAKKMLRKIMSPILQELK